MLETGRTVICAGGGGVPVVRDDQGDLRGVDAVVDKDLTTALLATRLQADALLLLTDVANVQRDYGTQRACAIGKTSVETLRGMKFAAGSMGPKVEGACRFVESTGGMAAIGRLTDAVRLLNGEAGTIVLPNEPAAAALIDSAGRSQEVTP